MTSASFLILLAVFLLHAAHLLLRRLSDEERSPRLENDMSPVLSGDALPRVSIVVPARNEEKHISDCLSSLTSLDYEPLEILVVNDRSTDRTGHLAEGFASRDSRVKVVQGEETPAGWTGKNFAIHQGACEAKGDFLLIVDSDTTLQPDTLRKTIRYAEEERVDLLTLYPSVVCSSFWERALLPWLGVLSIFRMDLVNDPRSKEAMAFGYFLLFRRTSFDQVGGYASIRDRVGEDWIIARRFKETGLCLRMLLGSRFVTKQFGPTLAEIWQGFTKNFILIMQGKKAVAVLAVPLMVYYLLFTTLPWISLVAAPFLYILGGWNAFWLLVFFLAALQLTVMGAVRSLLRFYLQVDVSRPCLQPLGGVVISSMGFTAIWRTLSGKGIVWKGRSYRKF